MIAQFPVPYKDELLSSVIARCIDRQGIASEKFALELLFGSRNIVPSSLFQGHIQALLKHVGHIWKVMPEDILFDHSLLGIYKPFICSNEFEIREQEFILSPKSQSYSRLGINASNLQWSEQFNFCPRCLEDDRNKLGETYWRRHFQLPGLSCCPEHGNLLINSGIDTRSIHRHAFVFPKINADQITSNLGDSLQFTISQQIYRLLTTPSKPHSSNQWSCYYTNLANDLGLMKGRKINHSAIKHIILGKWGNQWLQDTGLDLSKENNWLLSMFRKHRHPFTYLQHLTTLIALIGDNFSIEDELKKVDLLSDEERVKLAYSSSNYEKRKNEYRQIWKTLLKKYSSLKEIRATREGARVYSWLYRFDRQWHLTHQPKAFTKQNNSSRVNWPARDLKIVRQLLKVEKETYHDLSLPRKSKAWYARQIQETGLVLDKCHKLHLCTKFFERYLESIEEYQVRRILCVITNSLNDKKGIPKIFEIERAAGLSEARIRKPAKIILKYDV